MTESDAGSYVVKVSSIRNPYRPDLDSSVCDSELSLQKSTLRYAPVTFTVQEGHVPTYDPSSIFSTRYVDQQEDDELQLLETVQINSSLPIYTEHSWFRNGFRISDGNVYNSTGSLQEGLSLQITYNNTADVVGDYIGLLWMYSDFYWCSRYFNLFLFPVSIATTMWSVEGMVK